MNKITSKINSDSVPKIPKLSEIKISIFERVLSYTENIWNIGYVETENWHEGNVVIPNWNKNWGHNILVPKDWELSFLQILKIIPELEQKLNINSQELYTFLAETLKITIVKFLRNFPKNEHEKLISSIVEAAILDGVSEEFINLIKSIKITPTLHIKNIIFRINKRTKKVLQNKNNTVFLDIISADLSLLLENIIFKRWKNLIYEFLKVFNLVHRNAVIEKYRNDPNLILEEKPDWTIIFYEITKNTNSSDIDNLSENWTKEREQVKKVVITILPIMDSQLKEQDILIRESLNIDYWKNLISNAPDENKKTAHIFAAIESLRQIISYFPHNTYSRYWQNPLEIIETNEIQCVWKSIVAHVFLEKLGIPHKWCIQMEHLDIMVFINWKQYLLQTNSNQLVLVSENIVDNKKWKIYTSKNFWLPNSWRIVNYQLWDPEYICFFAMAWNIVNWYFDNLRKIECYKKLLEYEWLNPIMWHNHNLWNEYHMIWDLENATKYFYAELKFFPFNKYPYLSLWNILFSKWKYLNAYFNYLNAIYFDCDINSWNLREWLINCRSKIEPNTPVKLTDKMKRSINWTIKTRNCSPKQILKALSYDPTNYELWWKLWLRWSSIQNDVAIQLYAFFKNKDYTIWNHVKPEVKDIVFQCILFYSNWEYQKIFDLFCSLWDAKI